MCPCPSTNQKREDEILPQLSFAACWMVSKGRFSMVLLVIELVDVIVEALEGSWMWERRGM